MTITVFAMRLLYLSEMAPGEVGLKWGTDVTGPTMSAVRLSNKLNNPHLVYTDQKDEK